MKEEERNNIFPCYQQTMCNFVIMFGRGSNSGHLSSSSKSKAKKTKMLSGGAATGGRKNAKEILALKKFLHSYEKLCAQTNSQINPWIRDHAKHCIDKRDIFTKVIFDFTNLHDSPPVLIPVFISSIRQTRYKYIKHIYIWNYPMSFECVAVLAAYMENPSYNTHTLHLMDCLLTPRGIERLTRFLPSLKFLSDISLDYNDIGDLGCQNLCNNIEKNTVLRSLHLNYCGLTEKSGEYLQKIINTSAVSELYINGNNLQCSGVLKMLEQCVEKALAEENDRLNQAENPKPKEEKRKISEYKKKEKKKKKKKKAKAQVPEIKIGPWVEKLHLVDNGIQVHSLEGPPAIVRCIQMFKTLILYSHCLKELDIRGNEIGNLASLLLLEAMGARKQNKLPLMKLFSTPKIQMPGIYSALRKFTTGKKLRKKKGKKNKKGSKGKNQKTKDDQKSKE